MPQLLAIVLGVVVAFSPGRPARSAPVPLSVFEAHELLSSPLRRVRVLDPGLEGLLGEGVRRSATLGHLLAAIQQTDVIVQIVPTQNLPLSTAARLLLVPNPREARFLRIQIRPEGTDADLIALLGHELQHALEVAERPDVRDERALAALYRRIGHRGPGAHEYDTQAAHDTGHQIRKELYATAQAEAALKLR